MGMDINSILGNANQATGTNLTSGTTQSTPSNALDANSFMQLFLAELQNQDPTQTMNTSDMINQFAQINTIEALSTLTQSEQNTQNAVQSMFAHQLLGTTVTVQDANGNTVTGTVNSITFNNGAPNLMVNNQAYPMSNLVSMS